MLSQTAQTPPRTWFTLWDGAGWQTRHVPTDDEERATNTPPTVDGEKARTLGRIVLGLGSFGTLFGLYVPLVNYPDKKADYSQFKSAEVLGTPGVWLVLAGSAALLLAATLLVERVQTRAKLGALLILACLQAVGAQAVCLIAFVLIWTDARDVTHAELGAHAFVKADFTLAAAIPLVSPALILAGAVWWCLNASARTPSSSTAPPFN
ncbi:hypothetical protein [Nocardia sp. NPDC056000]|uniref:hypothetical protein n=1 Tax=Nocardia sp. NPDC056000 TaxID=3345674 RepID=UPI0035E14305